MLTDLLQPFRGEDGFQGPTRRMPSGSPINGQFVVLENVPAHDYLPEMFLFPQREAPELAVPETRTAEGSEI